MLLNGYLRIFRSLALGNRYNCIEQLKRHSGTKCYGQLSMAVPFHYHNAYDCSLQRYMLLQWVLRG